MEALLPTLLIVPELDLVAEDSLRIFPRFQAAGVDVQCRLYRGATHSFLEAVAISSLASEAIDDGADFVRDHLGLSG